MLLKIESGCAGKDMNREEYDKLIETFFQWDQTAIIDIVKELLSAVAAEDAQNPANVMSQNYATAQANPEIHMLPCLLYTSPSPRDQRGSRMPSSA